MILPSTDGGTGCSGRIIGPSQQMKRRQCNHCRHMPGTQIAEELLPNQHLLVRQLSPCSGRPTGNKPPHRSLMNRNVCAQFCNPPFGWSLSRTSSACEP
jgi:hypothetical protein